MQVSVQKTKWYLLEFAWDLALKWHLVKNKAYLSLETHEGYQQIERLPPSQASRILGVWISPDGSSHEKRIRLHQTTSSWADRVRSGHVRKSDAWFYLQSTVKKSIEYPLVATAMKSSQCKYIESIALCTALKASGFPPNAQIDIVAGPSSLLILKNRSLYGTQGSKHILVLMNLGKSDCITGQHLRDSIEAHKLEIGCSGYLFSNNIFPLLK